MTKAVSSATVASLQLYGIPFTLEYESDDNDDDNNSTFGRDSCNSQSDGDEGRSPEADEVDLGRTKAGPDKSDEVKPEVHLTFTLEPTETTRNLGARELVFRSAEKIYENDASVFRGTLSRYSGEDVTVVCKLEASEVAVRCLRHEATMYETKLRDMQGRYIPRFYGLYLGTIASEPAACLILEDCGITVGDFSKIPLLWR